jgi:hypothetical protein
MAAPATMKSNGECAMVSRGSVVEKMVVVFRKVNSSRSVLVGAKCR